MVPVSSGRGIEDVGVAKDVCSSPVLLSAATMWCVSCRGCPISRALISLIPSILPIITSYTSFTGYWQYKGNSNGFVGNSNTALYEV